MTSAVVLHSGGLDSSTALVMALRQFDEVVSFGVNYGQKHKKELVYAQQLAAYLMIPRVVVEVPIGFGKSALLGEMPVPEGHYAEANMVQTVVPNRNMIMIALAVSYAEAHGIDSVLAAIHAGDHFIYPDCRPDFANPMAAAIAAATEGRVRLFTPFLYATKADIARDAVNHGLPVNLTWSCYEGGEKHCGRCGTCYERREAFELARVRDDTEYDLSLEEWEAMKLEKSGIV